MDDTRARLLRARAQLLVPGPGAPAVAEVTRATCGLQAQLLPAAALGVRARSAGLRAHDVDVARLEQRSVVRTWGPRGTLHLLAAEDAGWLVGVLRPAIVAGNARRYRQLGLDEDTLERGVAAVCGALSAHGPLTRGELAGRVRGVDLSGQRAPYLVQRAALEGLVCYGPDRGAEPTFVLRSDWIETGPPLAPGVAAAELVRRYLAAYGPAGPQDLAAWSGLGVRAAQAAWAAAAGALHEVEVGGRPAWLLAADVPRLSEPPPSTPVVRLLGHLDTWLLGYRDRGLVLDREHTRTVWTGGGFLVPTLTVDGRVEGTWRSAVRSGRLRVEVEPFAPLRFGADGALAEEVADLGRFLDLPADLVRP